MNKAEGRKALWDYLLSLRSMVSNLPWLIVGDFNEIRKPSQKLGSLEYDYVVMEKFN